MRLLRPISLLFGGLVVGRHKLFRFGVLTSHRLPVPVVIIGNRVIGGAGKTPTVMALVAHLRHLGLRPGIISRGYGAHMVSSDPPRIVSSESQASDCGDEPLLLHRRCQVPVAVGPDRVATATALLSAHPSINILVCDDGLQHLRLARDLEIIVFDEQGAGNGWLLPSGPLREPLDTPSLATYTPPLTLYTAGQPSTPTPGFLGHRNLRQLIRLEDWWAGHKTGAPIHALVNRPNVWAVAGLAHPQRFFDLLMDAGLTLKTCPLPDHHDYATLPWPDHAHTVVLTEKDAIKLPPGRLSRERPTTQVWVAALDFSVEPAFWLALDRSLTHILSRHGQPLA